MNKESLALPKPLLFIITVAVASILLFGCGASKYQTLSAFADFAYDQSVYMAASYETATLEDKDFLAEKVHPVMNVAKHCIIAVDAGEQDDPTKVAAEVGQISLITTGTRFDYDPTALINAIKGKDYSSLRVELLVLKTKILQAIEQQQTELKGFRGVGSTTLADLIVTALMNLIFAYEEAQDKLEQELKDNIHLKATKLEALPDLPMKM